MSKKLYNDIMKEKKNHVAMNEKMLITINDTDEIILHRYRKR